MQFKAILQKGLKNNPEERYQSAEEMLNAIESGISGDIEVGCPVSAMLKGFFLVQKSLVKYPITTSLTITGLMVGFLGGLIYLGTLL
jgi:hypothetical protein